ncbi:MAG: histidine kinase [Proteobacteria bacterium]|nr:MAG: histidine kinase [Pseudomonadota bacterium]
MPSLLRFLTVVAVLAGLGYLAVFALANLVEPQPRQMTVTITPDKFVKD